MRPTWSPLNSTRSDPCMLSQEEALSTAGYDPKTEKEKILKEEMFGDITKALWVKVSEFGQPRVQQKDSWRLER